MLAIKLKEARELRGLTHYQVEKETGVDNWNLMRYESGDIQPRDNTLTILCDFYGFPLAQAQAWRVLDQLSPEATDYLRQEICR